MKKKLFIILLAILSLGANVNAQNKLKDKLTDQAEDKIYITVWQNGKYIQLRWNIPNRKVDGYNIYKKFTKSGEYKKVNSSLILLDNYVDTFNEEAEVFYKLNVIENGKENDYQIIDHLLINTADFVKNEYRLKSIMAFQKNNIISNQQLLNSSVMSQPQIQAFLVAWNSVLKDYTTNGKLASQIIYDACLSNGISPYVILTTLHKEQGLIGSSTTDLQRRIDWAMGYGARGSYPGFENQINSATHQLKNYNNNIANWHDKNGLAWAVGQQRTVEDGTVIVENIATVGLYIYTPWIGSSSGVGGNYLFWNTYYNVFLFGESVISPLSNDNCPGESIISNGAVKHGTVAGATHSIGANQCLGCNCRSDDDNDVYYNFEAKATSHTVTISKLNNFDAVIELRKECASGTANYISCYDEPGMPSTVSHPWDNLIVGKTYYVRVFAYNSNSNPPSDPTFDISVTHIENNSKPDLIVLNEQVTPSTVSPGQPFTVSCKVKNQGIGNAVSSYTAVWLSKDEEFDGEPTDYNLNADMLVPALNMNTTSGPLTKQVVLPDPMAPGSWYIMFGADATNTNPNESDEYNNIFFPITIGSSCTTPTTPTLSSLSSITSNSVNLSWNNVGASNYDVYYTTGSCPWNSGSLYQNTTNTSITVSGLTAGTAYKFIVVAKNSSTCVSGNSNCQSATTTSGCTPPNNECSGATDIPLASGNTTFVNYGTTVACATQSFAANSCNNFQSASAYDVWFKFTPIGTGTYTITMTPSSSSPQGWDGVIEVFQGNPCTGTSSFLDCADPSGGANNATVTLPLTISNTVTHYIRVYDYGSASTQPSDPNFNLSITAPTISSCTVPTTQGSNLTFSGVSTNSMTASWANGNGSRRVVKVNTSNSFTAPGSGTNPTANSSYNGSGEQVVYNGTGNSVSVTGLSAGTLYWFMVFEANCTGSSSIYNSATATSNPNSQSTTSSSCIAPYDGIISPSNPTVAAGNGINLSVTANGTTPFTYHWYWWNGSDWSALSNSSPYSGTTTQTLTINPTSTSMDGNYYTCVVYNSCGQTAMSNVQLAVTSGCTDPVITAHPDPQNKTVSETATFIITASGSNIQYQWQVKTAVDDWNNIAEGGAVFGTTTATLTINNVQPSINGCQFRCVVSNPCGTILSNGAILTVSSCIMPGIPASVTGVATSQSTANLSWSAGSPVGSAEVSYYWVVGTSSNVEYGYGIDQGITTGTSATAIGLSVGTTYYLRVYAKTSCDGSISDYRTSSSFTTATSSCSAPSAPASCSVTMGVPANGLAHYIHLYCDIVLDADGYSWERSFDGTEWLIFGQGLKNDRFDNLEDSPNIPVYYRVRAFKCTPQQFSNYTYPSSPQPIYTACDDAAAPTVSGATTNSLNVSLNAETPMDNPSYTTYSIYCTTASQYLQLNGTLGSNEVFQTKSEWGTKTVNGLSINMEYCFYAKARNNDGDVRFNPANIACGTTVSGDCTTPGTPASAIGAATGQTTASLTWSAGSPTGSSVVTYYWVVVTNSSVTYGNGIAQGTTTGTSASADGLSAGTIYYLRVYAKTSCDGSISGYKTSASFTTDASCTTPGTPASAIGAATGQTTASLSWSAGSPVGSSVVTYYWVVGTSSTVTYGNGIAQNTSSGTSASATGLSPGTTYYLRVFATTNCNNTFSDYGTSSAFTTDTSSCTTPYDGIISPSSPTVTAPNSTSLTVTANGTAPFTYQWYQWNGTDWSTLSNSSPYSGTTTQTLTINPTSTSMNGNYYTCLISNSCGSQNNISSVQLAVNSSYTAPIATVNSPTGTSPLVMTCTASGVSGGTIAYKWYSGISCSGTVLGTSSTLSVTASGSYSCMAYITGYESTYYYCATGYATIGNLTCTDWSVSPNAQSVPSSGGSYQAEVFATGSCSYNLTFNDDWIHFVNYPSGGGFAYSVDANSTCSSRTGIISVNNVTDGINNIVTLTVTEAGSSTPVTPTIKLNGNFLRSDAASGNQWYNLNGLVNGATTQDFTPSSSGDYYVVVSINGCSSNSSNSIHYIPTGIDPTEANKSVKVYPNPVTNELIIEIEGNTNQVEFEIINTIGQVVFTGSLVESITVPTKSFTPGMYLIKLKSGKTVEFKKIVKK